MILLYKAGSITEHKIGYIQIDINLSEVHYILNYVISEFEGRALL